MTWHYTQGRPQDYSTSTQWVPQVEPLNLDNKRKVNYAKSRNKNQR